MTDFGAVPEPRRDNTDAIQACIDAAGGRVVVPLGEFRCGTLQLRDGVELHLAHGAVLRAIERAEAFPEIPPAEPSRMDERATKAFLYAATWWRPTACSARTLPRSNWGPVRPAVSGG